MRIGNKEKGFALPVALFMLMVMTAAASLYSTTTQQAFRQVSIDLATSDTFHMAEGAVHMILGEMAAIPELWREKSLLEDLPEDYTQYSPENFSATNGIPSCSGIACHRHMYPVGGGLVKNFGPTGGDGDVVDTSVSIIEQLDQSDLPAADTSLNGRSAWVQVEKLDEVAISDSSVGGSLSSGTASSTSSNPMRFRVTSVTLRELRETQGKSTVVYVVEIPAT